MPIPVRCACGRSYRVKDELAGRKARCPGCQQIITVPALALPEDEPMEVIFEDAPPPMPAPHPAPRTVPRAAPPPLPAEAVAAVRPAPRRPEPPDEDDSEPEERPRKKKKKRRAARSSGPLIVIAPEIVAGVLMMIGAAVWFVLGLKADRIYIYPPILFILGIASIVRGFMGGD